MPLLRLPIQGTQPFGKGGLKILGFRACSLGFRALGDSPCVGAVQEMYAKVGIFH